jgi:hypothetical protein
MVGANKVNNRSLEGLKMKTVTYLQAGLITLTFLEAFKSY